MMVRALSELWVLKIRHGAARGTLVHGIVVGEGLFINVRALLLAITPAL